VARTECEDHIRHQRCSNSREGPQTQLATAKARELSHLRPRSFDSPVDILRILQEGVTRFGEDHTPGMALDEDHDHLLLKLGDLLRDR